MDRFEINFNILRDWFSLRQHGKTLSPWFEDNCLQSVALYGLGSLGELLEEELKQIEMPVAYAIDRVAKMIKRDYPVYGINEKEYPEIDVIIVATPSIYWEVVDLLRLKTLSPIISIEDIVAYCLSVREG